jgi:hypothetical protein
MIHPAVRPDAPPGSWQTTEFGQHSSADPSLVPYGHSYQPSLEAALIKAWKESGPMEIASQANPQQTTAICPQCGMVASWSQVEATPAGTQVVYQCAHGHRFAAQEPAHPPEFFQTNPYQEWWRSITPGVEGEGRSNPCWPCLLL